MVIFVWAWVVRVASNTTDTDKRILENLRRDSFKSRTFGLVAGRHRFSLAQAFTPGSRIKAILSQPPLRRLLDDLRPIIFLTIVSFQEIRQPIPPMMFFLSVDVCRLAH